jgi:transcriptional regulator of arginine metabolism
MSTQDELREELVALAFTVTQSTVSRDLRHIGAVKTIDAKGQTVYRLPEEMISLRLPPTNLKDMVLDIQNNGAMIVLMTAPDCASLVARHLDLSKPFGMLGTIAGDDTIFVAPANLKNIPATIKAIRDSLQGLG